jgi:hypothetical protein
VASRLKLALILVALACLVPAAAARAASGAYSTAAPTTTTSGADPGATAATIPTAHLNIRAKGLSGGRATILQRLKVVGHLAPFAPNQTVLMRVFRNGAVVRRRNVTPKKVSGSDSGVFGLAFRVKKDAHFRVTAYHALSAQLSEASAAPESFKVRFPGLHEGQRSPLVTLLNQLLRGKGYPASNSHRYDSSTARAVLAFRKVNGLHRTGATASSGIFRTLFRGGGGFHLKHPTAGHHVEADISRQVMVLASNGKAQWIFPVSSGKPSTPTIRGLFHFYRRTPGYNSLSMYYSVYFHGGYATHGYHSVPNYPASHGCLRSPIPVAHFIYNWISLGDPIYVYG